MASTFKRRSSGGSSARVTSAPSSTSASAAAAAAATSGVTAEDATSKSIITDKNTDGAAALVGVSSSSKLSSVGISSDNNNRLLLKGTKLWTGGIALTSSGLRDLDNLLGSGITAAGQPLGTCISLEQDRWTQQSLSLSLVKYWCAEAISHGQHLVIPIDTFESKDDIEVNSSSSSADHWNEMNDGNNDVVVNSQLSEVQSLLDSLPRNLHWDRQQQKADAAANAVFSGDHHHQQQQQQHLDTLQEEEDDDEDDHNEAEQGLKIAWQYRKSVQREMLGHDHATSRRGSKNSGGAGGGEDIFCHSFDLQGRLKDQIEVNKAVEILLPASSSSTTSCGFAWYRQIQAKLQELLPLQSSQPRQVVRLLFYHSNPCILQVALPLTLAYIRHYQLPVVVMIATCPWKHQQASSAAAAMRLLRRMVDVVLETEGFASRSGDFYPPPPEFRNFQGLLRVVKMSTVTAATAVSCGGGGASAGGHFADRTIHKGPAADLYGLKRDRRKLRIQLLHIPPEDYAQGGGSVGGGGVRSGAGRVGTSGSGAGGGGCGSSAGRSALDF